MFSDFVTLAAQCPFLASIGAAARTRLEVGTRRVILERGRVLFLEGDLPDAAYLLAGGTVRIFVAESDGRVTTVRLAGVGELFGELAIVDGGQRSASAIVLQPTVAFRIPAGLLDAELPEEGTIARGALRSLVAIVRADTKRLVSERTQGVDSAIARLLGGDPELLRRFSQGELADLVGVSRQSFNETLRGWERDGLVGRNSGRMYLADPVLLRARYAI
jgi:CRP/FNR family transcriptional regulator, cyclic AMP receptor protein